MRDSKQNNYGNMLIKRFFTILLLSLAFLNGALAQNSELEVRARKGDAEAQGQLGFAYQEGLIGYKKNTVLAKELLLKGANGGDPFAQDTIANNYFFGKNGFEKDDVKSSYWAEKSYDSGNLDAAITLSYVLVSSERTQEEQDKGIAYLKNAAGSGNFMAMYRLGKIHSRRSIFDSGSEELDEAIYWYKKAYEFAETEDQKSTINMDLADMYMTGRTKEGKAGEIHGIKILEDEIRKNNVKAMSSLGFYLMISNPPDSEEVQKGVQLYIQAVKLGDKKTLERLTSEIYPYKGNDEEVNQLMVDFLKDKSKESEDNIYDERLGLWYFFGKFGLEENYRAAEHLFLRALEKGESIRSSELLGYMYYLGEGVRYDPEKAILYLSKAGEKSKASAMLLGEIYLKGKGVPTNLSQAKEWYGKACDLGLDNGCKNYKILMVGDSK